MSPGLRVVATFHMLHRAWRKPGNPHSSDLKMETWEGSPLFECGSRVGGARALRAICPFQMEKTQWAKATADTNPVSAPLAQFLSVEGGCRVIAGISVPPPRLLCPWKTYVFFLQFCDLIDINIQL